MKLPTIGALVALSLFAAGCSGCQSLADLTGDKPIAGQTALDEKAMGAVYALGTSANTIITATANSGVASREQLLQAKELRADIDAAVKAAETAYKAGDAATFAERLAAVTSLNNQAQALFSKVRK